MNPETGEEKLHLTELTRQQRRVLGVLIEKAYTTSEYYPLTLKAITTGASQKSNRSPVVSYDEDDIQDVLEELREIGLVGEVHTDGGRAPRYRHYMRHRFDFTEPQLAILTELLLRGKQQLGELRSRASRMVQIASQADLRTELKALLEGSFIQADGPIDRRGIDVDHNWYTEREGNKLTASDTPALTSAVASTTDQSGPARRVEPAGSSNSESEVNELRARNSQLMDDMRSLQDEIESLRGEFQQLNGQFDDLRRALGG
jgi:uncharacterized protein YceH (UPF0502 family)